MRHLHLAVAALLAASPAFADGDQFEPAMRHFLESEVSAWAEAPILIDAIRDANAARGDLDQAAIDALDAAWQSEVGTADTPTIDPVLNNAAADFLREHIAMSGGRITEVFIMDRHGLNVAASGLTSDMWQGDEEKFTMSFGHGANGVHIGNVDLDESTQRYQGQISVTVIDPETGEPIGALTVGVDAESLL
ncbi:hypothetical protein HKCCE2091_09290 [Rhodobacterales bacterium HKCCE2091]|nr:hypothetical protein [Rhodobacterales bacterium HKCCE2091]